MGAFWGSTSQQAKPVNNPHVAALRFIETYRLQLAEPPPWIKPELLLPALIAKCAEHIYSDRRRSYK